MKAEKAEIRRRLLEESSKSGPDPLHKETSRGPKAAYKRIEGLTEQQGIKDSNMAGSRQPEERAGQDTIHLAESRKKSTTWATLRSNNLRSLESHIVMHVTEIEDESTMCNEATSGKERPSRAGSLVPSSRRTSQESGHHQPLMILLRRFLIETSIHCASAYDHQVC